MRSKLTPEAVRAHDLHGAYMRLAAKSRAEGKLGSAAWALAQARFARLDLAYNVATGGFLGGGPKRWRALDALSIFRTLKPRRLRYLGARL